MAVLDSVEAAVSGFDLLAVGDFLVKEGSEVFSFRGGLLLADTVTWPLSQIRA